MVHLKVELDKCACVFSERVKMEVTAVEEKCDRRIELLTQSIKKNRKRTRIERAEEDDEEWVPKMFLHTEQNKVKVSGVETSCLFFRQLFRLFAQSVMDFCYHFRELCSLMCTATVFLEEHW